MGKILVDTNVLIDYKNTGAGNRHQQAIEIVRGIDSGELPTGVVTDSVLLETLNWIHERQRHDIAVDLRQRLSESAGFELVHSAQADFHRSVELFETYDGLAFGDAVIAAYMERTDIEYLFSWDDDFDALDRCTRLSTAENPFRGG